MCWTLKVTGEPAATLSVVWCVAQCHAALRLIGVARTVSTATLTANHPTGDPTGDPTGAGPHGFPELGGVHEGLREWLLCYFNCLAEMGSKAAEDFRASDRGDEAGPPSTGSSRGTSEARGKSEARGEVAADDDTEAAAAV